MFLLIQIDQPEFGLAREFLLNEEEPTLQHYYNFMVDMAVIFGANVTTAPYELLETVNFERALANVRAILFWTFRLFFTLVEKF